VLRDLHSFPTRRSSDLTQRWNRATVMMFGMTDDTNERNRVDTGGRSVSYLSAQDRPSSRRSCHDSARSWWVLGCAAVAVIVLCRSEEHTSELQSRFDLV